MTARDLLAEDRLSDAIVTQRALVDANPIDFAARLMMFELFVVAGRFLDAHAELKLFEEGAREFRKYAQSMRRLLRAERRRQHDFKPSLLADPPMHLRCRWHAVKASRDRNVVKTLKWADRAEEKSPHVRGHVNGRPFEGMRDADDRFASLFEFLVDKRYYWVPFEQVKKLTLGAAEGVLDTVLRPAEITLHKNLRSASLLPLVLQSEVITIQGHLPLVYPGTAFAGRDESLVLGRDADFTELAGMVIGIGERVMTFGEEEIPLGEVQQLEIKK